MAIKPPRICSCGKTVQAGAVCECAVARRADYDRGRGNARQRGYDAEWERESAAFLAMPQNKFCACGCGREADMVDHKRAHKGDVKLFRDRTNWQPMNRRCNSRKTVREEGGFGKPSRYPAHVPVRRRSRPVFA